MPTGITPIIQVLREVIKETNSGIEIWVLTSNKSEADILCREELESYIRPRYHLHHAITCPPSSRSDWTGSIGTINQDMLKKYMPPVGKDTLILASGPEGMINMAIKPELTAIGWNVEESLVVF